MVIYHDLTMKHGDFPVRYSKRLPGRAFFTHKPPLRDDYAPLRNPPSMGNLSDEHCGKSTSHDGSMFGIYANIWGILMVNATIYIYI